MKWAVVHTEKEPKERDCVALPVFKDEVKSWKSGPYKFIEKTAKKALATGDFSGKQGEVHVTYPDDGATRFILLGLGERTGAAELHSAYTALGKSVEGMGIPSCTFLMTDAVRETAPHSVRLFMDGFTKGTYRFDRYLKKPKKSKLKGMMVLLPSDDCLKEGLKDAKVGKALAEARSKMMDIANEPPNVATPDFTAKAFKSWFRDDAVKIKVLKRAQLEKLGLNLVLSVGQASANDQRMVIMEYRGGRVRDKPLILVGKGVTFDGGGMSIKSSDGMKTMKQDMAGSAAVAATMYAVSQLKLKVNLIAITPLVENVIGPNAYKVSDVIKSYSGKTVEVLNTDAEGRLILADALAYAVDMKPDHIIDIATLTGASIIAIGKVAAATMGNDREVLDRLAAAAEVSGERVWELPMWKAYDPLVKSKIADVKNISGKREAGSIVGGKFLETFVDGTPWVHIDMAPTFVDKNSFSSGYGVGLLLVYIMLYIER